MYIKKLYYLILFVFASLYIFSANVSANVSLGSVVTQNTTSTPYTSQCATTYKYAIYEGQSFYLYHTHTPSDLGSTWEYFGPSNVVTYNYLNVIGNSINGNNIGGKFTDFKYNSNGRLGTNHFSNIGGGIQTAQAWKEDNNNRAIKPNPNPNRVNLVGQVVHILNRKQIQSRGGSYFSMTTYNFNTNNTYTQNANPDTYYGTVEDKKCQNFYIAKCGDGIQDNTNKVGGSNTNGKQGMQTNDGFVTRAFPSTVTVEQCDGTDGLTAGYTCNAQCQLVPIPQQADLSVTKIVSNPTPTIGSNITFTMILSNAGPYNAGNVTLTDILPSGYTYISNTTTQGTYNSTNGIRNVGTINVGTTKTLTITAQVKSAGNYLNTIEVTSSDKQDPDSTPNNHVASEDDQASATVTPVSPAPTCALILNPSSTTSGSLVSLSWIITGSFLSPTYIYVNPLIAGAFPHLVNTPTGITYLSQTQIGTYTFTMTVTNPLNGLTGVCTAILNVGQTNPILTIQKTVLGNTPAYYSGDQIGFKISFQNNGSGTANNVVLTDILPSSLTYVAASIYGTTNQNMNVGMSGANTVITFSNFNLAPGASGYMIITGTLNTNNAGNNRTNYTDIYASNHPLVSATALFPVGEIPSNNVTFTKIGNKSTYQLGESIQFTITTTNNGPAPITDLTITDTRPNSSCITYSSRSSPDGFVNNASMSRVRSGTLATGQTVTLTLSGTISTNPSCALGFINTTNLTYYVLGQSQNKTASFPFNVLAGGQCQSLTSVYGTVILMEDGQGRAKFTCNTVNGIQGNIRVECGNNTQFQGFGSTLTNYCDYNSVGTYTVKCYVDNTTNQQCTETIIVDEGMLGYCGNGIKEGIEKCDLGEDDETINNQGCLDVDCNFKNKKYAGYRCENCAIKKQGYYEAPACNGISTTLSVQKGEVLPFRWELEGNNLINGNSCKNADFGDIPKDSIKCTFKIFNGKKYLQEDDKSALKITKDCNIDERDGHTMFDYFENLADEIYHSLDNAFGKYYFTANNTSNGFLQDGNNDTFGEYKLVLDKVAYKYCYGNDKENGTEIDRICEVNFAVTKPYLMQKSLFGVTPKATTVNLDDFRDMKGDKIINKTDLSSIMKVDANDYAGGTKMDKQIVDFVNKYTKLSVKLPNPDLTKISNPSNDIIAKKVPGKQIYILEGKNHKKITFTNKEAGFTKPFTLILKNIDVIIEGNLTTNGMFVVQGGKITFKEVDYDLNKPSEYCKSTQVVQGIFISDRGFGITGDMALNIANDLDKPRCNRGGLNIKGVLIGDNINDLVLQRRSQLNDRFRVHSNNENQIKIERRNKIFVGASVLIEYSPSLRGSLPPGASDFTKVLEVYKK